MENYNVAIPYRAFHVGEFLKEQLDYAEISQGKLSTLSGVPKSVINDIIKGRRDITAEQSAIFGEALGVDADYFWKLQERYEMDKARVAERVREQTAAIRVWELLKSLVSIPFLKKAGVVESKDVKADVSNIFSVFGVNGLDSLIGLKSKPANAVYRKSDKLETDENALFTWKYYCIFRSKQMDACAPFSRDKMEALLSELSEIFFYNENVLHKVDKTLGKYGIKFIIAPKYGKIPVDAISFWIGANPTIAVTMRYDRIDTLAFSIFHELGHILMHLTPEKGDVINPGDGDNKILEDEADRFAQKKLIPDSIWKIFKSEYKRSTFPLERFVTEFGCRQRINPRIIYGRYCHEMDNYRHKVSIPYRVL